MVVLPAPAEPHAHLDKSLSNDREGNDPLNPWGDLDGAVDAWHRQWPLLTFDDLVDRGSRSMEQMVLHGTTAVRTHVDVGGSLGLRAIEALAEVKRWASSQGLADVQLVALVACPVTGEEGIESRCLLAAAMEAGADLVGGCPYRDADPVGALRFLLDTAECFGVGVDLHTDETLDPSVLTVVDLALEVEARRFPGPVTASHCVSLGVQPTAVQMELGRRLAAVGASVVTLPQTNLFLQARGRRTSPPRALTAVHSLLEAGVNVAAGGDNVRDPFCTVGRMDATETAALLVMAGHLDVSDAWSLCTRGARAALGLDPVTLRSGSPAELVCIEGASLTAAVAAASEHRITVHRGHVVARATVQRSLLSSDSFSADGGGPCPVPQVPAGDDRLVVG